MGTMRAILILAVLMGWAYFVLGTLALAGYLVFAAFRARTARRPGGLHAPSTLPHLTFAALAGTTAVVVHRQPAT